ncbi:MAG: MFS transporter [Chloroflexota bacterium]
MTAVVSDPSSVAAGRHGITPEQRRSIALLGGEISLFMIAMGLVGPLTFVPLFVSHLSDNPMAVGAVTAAFQLGWLPQLFVAGYVERSHRKWPWVRWFGSIERLPSLVLALCALAVPVVGPPILIVVYLACFAQSMAGGLATTPWMDVVARAVPARLRGRFMGGFSMIGTLLGAGAAALAAPVLDSLGYPYGFAVCFGLAFGIFLFSLIPLFLFREPPGPPPRPKRPLASQLAELPAILSTDHRFRRFVGGLACAALGTMSNGFLVVYAVTELGAPDELAAWYTATLLVAQTSGSLILGWLADRYSFRMVGIAVALATAGQAIVALTAPGATWLLGAFVLLGAAQSGGMLARMTGPVDYAPHERLPTYVALSGALVSACTAIAPLVGGQIVAALGFPWLFGLSAVAALAALPILGPGANAPARQPVPVPVRRQETEPADPPILAGPATES